MAAMENTHPSCNRECPPCHRAAAVPPPPCHRRAPCLSHLTAHFSHCILTHVLTPFSSFFSSFSTFLPSILLPPSGRLALSTGRDKTLRLWNLIEGRAGFILKHKEEPLAVEWAPGGASYALLFKRHAAVYSAADGSEMASVTCDGEHGKDAAPKVRRDEKRREETRRDEKRREEKRRDGKRREETRREETKMR